MSNNYPKYFREDPVLDYYRNQRSKLDGELWELRGEIWYIKILLESEYRGMIDFDNEPFSKYSDISATDLRSVVQEMEDETIKKEKLIDWLNKEISKREPSDAELIERAEEVFNWVDEITEKKYGKEGKFDELRKDQ